MSFVGIILLFTVLWGEGLKTGDTVQLLIGRDTLKVEVVADSASRRRGLMDRFELAPNGGMLFVFPKEGILSFWMKRTFIPLSIAFLDSSGVIVGIDQMEPLSLESHISPRPSKFALEVPLGWFEERGINAGDSVVLIKDTLKEKN